VEFEMEFKDLKVGQTVEHENGFIGKIIAIEGNYEDADIIIEVTDSGDSSWSVGYRYEALARYINRIVKHVVPTLPVFPEKVTVEAELEFTGLEKLEELIGQAEEALEIINEAKPFKANIQGVEFEGTPAQFESFVATMTKYLGNLS
jgi:hypothetical protein